VTLPDGWTEEDIARERRLLMSESPITRAIRRWRYARLPSSIEALGCLNLSWWRLLRLLWAFYLLDVTRGGRRI